jgi:regulator of sigma E protease
MITAILFILILSVVVISHEWGHFMAAIKSGVKVDEFGFGFPPKLFGYRPKGSETEYTFNLLPIGGFVRLEGEDGEHKDDPRSFAAKGYWTKVFILSAGVMMNLVVAFLAFTIAGVMGARVQLPESEYGSPEFTDQGVTITTVIEDSPADDADLRFGDIVTSVNGEEITSIDGLQEIIKSNEGSEISMVIERGNQTLEKQVLARDDYGENEGATGIAIGITGIERMGLFEAMGRSVQRMLAVILLTFQVLFILVESIFTSTEVPAGAEVTGPVGLVNVINDFRDLGAVYLINLVGLISMSLAIFNILPIPALDGGRILFATIEKVKGSPINPNTEAIVHTVAFYILIGLMIMVAVCDVINIL